MGEQLSDETVEHLLSGNRDIDELGRLLGAIKTEFDAIDAPEPRPELRAFIDNASGAAPAPADELSISRKRRRRFAAVAATGTTLGKLMIGVSAAAASVAGMHVTGLVDVPVLPDRRQPPESVTINDTNQVSPARLPATISPEPTVPVDDLYSFDAVDAGTVDIGVSNAEVVSAFASAGPGWKSQVSIGGTAVDVAFNRADDKVDVRAVLDGDLLHVVISDHRTGTSHEFWLDNDRNRTLPDKAPEPQQQRESTPAPAGTRTDDKNSDDDDDDSDDSTPATDDDDRTDDDRTDDDHDSDESDDDHDSDDSTPATDEDGDRSDDHDSDDDQTDDESESDEPDHDTSDDDESDGGTPSDDDEPD